ncbi:hypothetical protein NECAME_00588 [Necator americanus]|uniref:Uncharacterized protein n=1 Tax=Necator americanus TaxID=51031 RepID=W2T2H1_NECAM|nr:hypothetical protein NECAME_00588 [Necator americanus]ETN75177.1 hypothetical protein NECAME_00588 [Necator americanus]
MEGFTSEMDTMDEKKNDSWITKGLAMKNSIRDAMSAEKSASTTIHIYMSRRKDVANSGLIDG